MTLTKVGVIVRITFVQCYLTLTFCNNPKNMQRLLVMRTVQRVLVMRTVQRVLVM